MDDLILRHLTGKATDVEEHRKKPSVESLIGEAETRRAGSLHGRRLRAFLRSPWGGYGLVAASVALAFLGLGIWKSRAPGGASLSPIESSVGTGQVVSMTLSDGSYVRVAPGGHLEFPAEAGRREVVLDGRAFFAVASRTDPFVVRTRIAEVAVHGTRFEVRVDGDMLRVVVVEGVVKLTGPGGSPRVLAEQVATVRAGGMAEVVTVGDVWPLLEWPGGLLAFQRTSLREVAMELERHFGIEVRIPDDSVAGLRVTGSFQGKPLDEVVQVVCSVTGIRCDQDGPVVILGEPAG